MSIKLDMPYVIIPTRVKRYASHYQIPAEQVLVIPLKLLGDEVSCDIRWEEHGEQKLLQNKVFQQDNLAPLNGMIDASLYELWQHYYEKK